MTIEPTIPTSSPGAGALLRLIRDGQASTRAELVTLTGPGALDGGPADGGAARAAARGPRRRERLHRRPAAADVRLQPRGRRGARRRPRRDPLTARRHRPRRRRPDRGRRGHRDRRGARGGPGLARDEARRAARGGRPRADATCAASASGVPGPVEFATGTPRGAADHARLGRLPGRRAGSPTTSARRRSSTTT